MFKESAACNHVLERPTTHQQHFSHASSDAARVRPDEAGVSGVPACSIQKRCQPRIHFSAQKHNTIFFRKPNRSRPCGAQSCAIYTYMVEADSFGDVAGNKYTVRNSVDCKSSNVVYAVFCERCRAYVYIGEAGDTPYQRHLLNLSRNPHTAC